MQLGITSDDWKLVSNRFQKLPVDGYWDVFDPLKEEPAVYNTLFDDLSDIYRDLKEGLLLFTKGQVVEAVWDWRFNFTTHWGNHLTGAQRVIQSYFSFY
jgi:hypothetical protein